MRVVVRDLRKTFGAGRGQGVAAVDGLSLEVDDGELVVILGPSGSGKTTLLRCIAGLERADAGEIVIDGVVVYSSARGAWVPPERRGVSMVFQSYALWPHMTAFDNVAYPLRSRGVARDEIRPRVEEALDLVGCGPLARRHPSELSGGQQQRIAVARAIVGGSRVVLFDEPLSSVDARVREELRAELVALQRELGFSAVYITHDQTEAMAIGHRVAVLAAGRIVQVAPPREVYARPASAYVAEFMGATDRFPGSVESVDDREVRVRTEMGPIVADGAGSPGVRVGQAVVVCVRPERYVVGPAAASGENTWRATVRTSLFLGWCTEYVLEVGERAITVRSADPTPLPEAREVGVSVPRADVRVVPAP